MMTRRPRGLLFFEVLLKRIEKVVEARDQGKESCFTSTTETLQCIYKVVICVQECSERFGNNPGIVASDKAACRFDCDEALKVCFESFE